MKEIKPPSAPMLEIVRRMASGETLLSFAFGGYAFVKGGPVSKGAVNALIGRGMIRHRGGANNRENGYMDLTDTGKSMGAGAQGAED